MNVKVLKLVSGEQVIGELIEHDKVQHVYKFRELHAIVTMVNPNAGQPMTQITNYIITDEEKQSIDGIHVVCMADPPEQFVKLYKKSLQQKRMQKIGIINPNQQQNGKPLNIIK